MKTWIVSYADASFLASRERLVESARKYRINEIRTWSRESLERTSFYNLHQAILDLPRGAGYWLWKPFIIEETLREMESGDVLIYSDSGIEIVGDLSPLVDLCLQKSEVMLFAGHYDDVGAPGPNLCGKWTKRDCFILMGCDEPAYHHGQMLDASFMVLAKTERSIAFVRDWFLYCAQSQILTDEPNRCGLPNIPGFIEHRHDQSILSILAIREGIEFFRHPSQYGNHLKTLPHREPGEWTRKQYGTDGIYFNSPYKTLLRHHRGAIGQKNLNLRLCRRIRAPQQQVFEVWAKAKNMKEWLVPPDYVVLDAEVNFRVGGKYRLRVMEPSSGIPIDLEGNYIEICHPESLVYTWPWETRVKVEFQNDGDSTLVVLLHESFPSEKIRDLHERGWIFCLDRLAKDFPAASPLTFRGE